MSVGGDCRQRGSRPVVLLGVICVWSLGVINVGLGLSFRKKRKARDGGRRGCEIQIKRLCCAVSGGWGATGPTIGPASRRLVVALEDTGSKAPTLLHPSIKPSVLQTLLQAQVSHPIAQHHFFYFFHHKLRFYTSRSRFYTGRSPVSAECRRCLPSLLDTAQPSWQN